MLSLKEHLILFRVYQIQWTQKSNHALSAHSQKDKNNGTSKRVVAVAYERWLFTKDSKCSDFIVEILKFRMGGRLWKAVAHKKVIQHGRSTVVQRQYCLVAFIKNRNKANYFANHSKL